MLYNSIYRQSLQAAGAPSVQQEVGAGGVITGVLQPQGVTARLGYPGSSTTPELPAASTAAAGGRVQGGLRSPLLPGH